jgi:hypothetical protein
MCKVTIEWLQRRGAIRSRLHIGCMHLCCAMMHRNKIYFANLPYICICLSLKNKVVGLGIKFRSG